MERVRSDRHSQPKIPNWLAQHDQNVVYVVSYTDTSDIFQTESDYMNPATVLTNMLKLLDTQKYDECAILINKLTSDTLKSILNKFPMEDMITAIPTTLGVVEALYSKLFFSEAKNFPLGFLRPRDVLSQMVRALATVEELRHTNGNYVHDMELLLPLCQNIIRIISLVQPSLRHDLTRKKLNLEACLEKLGSHGLVNSSDSKLLSLHDALKIEFNKTIHMYKTALQRLEDPTLTHKRKLSMKGNKETGAPSSVSHQRLMQISQSEVQDRLIMNKSLLNAVEPAINNSHMTGLFQILEARIESDKSALFNFSELRREMHDLRPIDTLSTYLQSFSMGYDRVLSMFQEVSGDDESLISDSSSWSDDLRRTSVSAQMLKHRYSSNPDLSFIERSKEVLSTGSQVLASSKSKDNLDGKVPVQQNKITSGWLPAQQSSMATRSLSVDTSSPEMDALKKEVETLKRELQASRETVKKYQERERILRDRLAEQAQKQLEKGTKFEDLNLGDDRPTQLIKAYGNLYSEVRLDALDSLDSLNELSENDDLKGKLLFSVVVLAFRSAQQKMKELKSRVQHLLYMNSGHGLASPDPVVKEMEQMIDTYLRKTAESYDVTGNIAEVSSQIYATLYDYPDLKTCEGLRYYIEECVRLAWKLNAQNPQLVIEFDSSTFSSDKHTRFHNSCSEVTDIKSYLWPSLHEGNNGLCVYKGVVMT